MKWKAYEHFFTFFLLYLSLDLMTKKMLEFSENKINLSLKAYLTIKFSS
jgi:hypothetical protein